MIGQVTTSVIPAACTDNLPVVSGGVAAAPDYTPSAYGVITSWSMAADATAGRTFVPMVLRPAPTAGLAHYTVVQKDQVRQLTQLSQLNLFGGLRMPIERGDRLGLYVPDGQPGGQGICSFATLPDADFIGVPGPAGQSDPPLNDTRSYGDSEIDRRLNAAAMVEPDADRDGFGDETQDACPTNAATQGVCPPRCSGLKRKARKRCLCKQKKAEAKRKRCLRRLKKAARRN